MVSRPGAMSQSWCRAVQRYLVLCLVGFVIAAVPLPHEAGTMQQEDDPSQTAGNSGVLPQLIVVTQEVGISFTNIYGGPDKSYIMEMGGSGAAWIDYDVDGRIDLLLVNALPDVTADPPALTAAYERGQRRLPEGAGHRMFRNRGGVFDDATAGAGVGDIVWGNGAAVADVDNDGFVDLYVTAIGSNRLYRNNGDGTFSHWQSGTEDNQWGVSAVFTDWDGDGNLDLYVANYVDFGVARIPALADGACAYRGINVHCGPEGLAGAVDVFYRNRGDGRFEPWPGVEIDADATYGLALLATDCDADGQPDIYVATDSTINLLYRRDATGNLEDWSLFSGAGYSGDGREQAGMGVTAADYDADGDFDLFVTNFQHDYNTLYTNVGGCIFDDDTARYGLAIDSLPYMGWGTQFFDVDGDGDQDIFVANGHVYPQMDAEGLEPWRQRNLLYLNDLAATGEPGFHEVGVEAGLGMGNLASSRGTAVADFDNDSDYDVLVTNINDSPTLLRNTGHSAVPALRISLVGRVANRSAYGAVVTVQSGGRLQTFELRGSDGYLGSNDVRLLVHLPGGTAETVQVAWPGGQVTSLQNVDPGWLVIDELRGVVARRQP